MDVSTASHGEAIVIAVSGRGDGGTAAHFEAALLEQIANRQLRLIIDLGGLEYINSAGLRVEALVLADVGD